MPEFVLLSARYERFINFLEEAARSRDEGARFFIEPATNVLGRAKSARHHIIFGRRGSGKSSLLAKIKFDLAADRSAAAFVDCEPFKSNTYPNVLILVLIELFKQIEQWMETIGTTPSSQRAFWKAKTDSNSPIRKPLDKKKAQALLEAYQRERKTLEKMLLEADEIQTERTRERGSSESGGVIIKGEVGSTIAKVGSEISGEASNTSGEKTVDSYRFDKREYLKRRLGHYRSLLQDLTALTQRPAFLLFDDLYHLRIEDQPHLVDYLHSLAKGTNAWLKIGTIRHRSVWYLPAQQIGMKLGDDASDIDLDVTLEDYDLARSFLVSVASRLAESEQFELTKIVTEDALDRLVLGSGGVARDMIHIFRRASSHAGTRLRSKETQKKIDSVSFVDVDAAIGELDSFKREELNEDASTTEAKGLMGEFEAISEFCFQKSMTNILLVEREYAGPKRRNLNALIDLKFLHVIKTYVAVKSRDARVYDALMLDMSQYIGARERKNLQIVEFWRKSLNVQLSQEKWIYCER